MGRPEGKRRMGRPRRRWEYKIELQFQEKGWRGTDWIAVAQDTDSKHGNEPSGSINAWNILTSWETVSFSERTLLRGLRNIQLSQRPSQYSKFTYLPTAVWRG